MSASVPGSGNQAQVRDSSSSSDPSNNSSLPTQSPGSINGREYTDIGSMVKNRLKHCDKRYEKYISSDAFYDLALVAAGIAVGGAFVYFSTYNSSHT